MCACELRLGDVVTKVPDPGDPEEQIRNPHVVPFERERLRVLAARNEDYDAVHIVFRSLTDGDEWGSSLPDLAGYRRYRVPRATRNESYGPLCVAWHERE